MVCVDIRPFPGPKRILTSSNCCCRKRIDVTQSPRWPANQLCRVIPRKWNCDFTVSTILLAWHRRRVSFERGVCVLVSRGYQFDPATDKHVMPVWLPAIWGEGKLCVVMTLFDFRQFLCPTRFLPSPNGCCRAALDVAQLPERFAEPLRRAYLHHINTAHVTQIPIAKFYKIHLAKPNICLSQPLNLQCEHTRVATLTPSKFIVCRFSAVMFFVSNLHAIREKTWLLIVPIKRANATRTYFYKTVLFHLEVCLSVRRRHLRRSRFQCVKFKSGGRIRWFEFAIEQHAWIY